MERVTYSNFDIEVLQSIERITSMTTDFRIDAIGQIHITVEDLPRAVEFYRDVLGMTPLFEVPEQSMAFFECGGIRLYLGKAEKPQFRSNPMIYYRVELIQDAYEALSQRGVEFSTKPHLIHKTKTSELWMAGFRDSEGNIVNLMSEVSV